MLPKIVAFVGPIGCGKTTAAIALRSWLGYEKISFADPLKEMLIKMGLTAEQVYGNEKETPAALLFGRTPRYAMQTLGTEWGRDLIAKDLWLRAWQYRTQRYQFVTVDDARFPNEFDLIRSLNGVLIKVVRPGPVTEVRHESETYDIPGDETVFNGTTEAKFVKEVITRVKSLSR